MYGYDVSFYDYGFSDPAITGSLYGNSLSPIDYDDGVYFRRRPPLRQSPPRKNPSSPPKHRHDGTSPLPLGMDWSPPPRLWDGRNSVWPHDSCKGWSYCVTVPSWTILPSASGSDTVFFRVQVGIQSPEGITTTRGVLRRFNEFVKLYSELRKEFPKKNLPPAPPRRLMKMRSTTLLEERRRGLEDWVEKLLSDIDVSRTAHVAIFLELEAAARSSFDELTQNEPAANSVPSSHIPLHSLERTSSVLDNTCAYETSDLSAPRPETENHAKSIIDDESETHPTGSLGESFNGNSSVNVVGGPREGSMEGLQGELVLPSEEHHKVNRVLTTVQERLGTTKMDMEDLVARLHQEIVAREYLTAKVKHLEMELETTVHSGKENLHQTISTERERSTKMQWDIDELQRKCMDLESRLATEQDARAESESTKAASIKQNETLLKELDDAKKQAEILKKQHDEVELKSKSDVKLLVKEVKSLRTSHSEMKRELGKCLEEKVELEKEKQKWEVGNASKEKLLNECEVLRNQLRECSISFIVDEEDKLVVDTSLSDAISLLETSDSRIDHLLSEARLLGRDVETSSRDDGLRMMIADIFTDNAKVRKQVNSVIRHALSTSGETLKNDFEYDTPVKTALDE